ncbi:SpoIID/LytB domain-containing protein [Desulfallas thermosapovorans]|uniref:Stage II sporulation protein D n=1 Tax=Desulfallas thermosapovorans DSM 6562 TaxID=1121431 RepID=A0A5S4ZXY2_9FIRM|nr:SpoIID/LytB domain-containing protein [Desulfallas thermosapovorans]TYO97941.1 stage II sporulation protein D [Desulfallas thermosapovorans DSM 6562]
MTSGVVIKHCRPGLLVGMAILLLVVFWPGGTARGDVQVVPHTVRVGLAQNMPQVSFVLQGDYKLVNIHTGQVIAGDGEGRWTVEYAGGLCRVLRNGEHVGLYNGPIKAESLDAATRAVLSGDGTLIYKDSLAGLVVQGYGASAANLYDGKAGLYALDASGQAKQLSRGGLNIAAVEKGGQLKHYRGNIEIRPSESGLTVINELPIEQYLYGVLPGEMPVSFPAEALKAQAVAARSYLITQLGSYTSYGFDVLDNQSNQVYLGYDGENPATNLAVDATSGMVLVHRGRPVAAFFHASSGGCTENSEDVWFDSLSYIRGQDDPLDYNIKHYDWSLSYSGDELVALVNRQLKKYINEFTELSAITDLRAVEYTASGQRVKKLLIEGLDAGGGLQVYTVANADRVRSVLGLNSALFTMQKETGAGDIISRVTFTGNGLGHGLGMSQYGAAGWASQGYSFQDILQYYYTNVKLVENYGA